jgi:Asp-tRNA(Asn)/Glu-tRNA(Gln) amidotransferase A subunit family amidase
MPTCATFAQVADDATEHRRLLTAMRERVAAVNGQLNAIVAMHDRTDDLTELPRGPLRGVPIAVKDCFALPWRGPHDGTPVPTPGIPAVAGTAVARLLRAGALPSLASSMHQLGLGTTGHISATGPVRNPHDTSRLAGGSSGGSAAAVAAGIVPAAIGTDAAGSVRVPASYCGVVGLKPTWNSVPTDGCTTPHSSVAAIGSIARSVRDCRTVAEVLLDRRLDGVDVSQLRIGTIDELWQDLDPEVGAVCRHALAALTSAGARRVSIDIPDLRHVAIASMIVTGTERVARLSDVWIREVFPTLDPAIRGLLKSRARIDATAVLRVSSYRTLLRRGVARAFAHCDLLVAPTVPTTAPPASRPRAVLPTGSGSVDVINLRYAGLANLTGIPAISVPAGASREGLPIGLTLHSAWSYEQLLLSAAEAVEHETKQRDGAPIIRGVSG